MIEHDVIKVLIPAVISFTVGIGITPVLTHYLYQFRVWKKTGGKKALDGNLASEFNRLHGAGETKTPRMGGIVIWASVLITITGISMLSHIWGTIDAVKLDFLSRDQTWIPLMTLIVGALIGFVSDLLDITEKGEGLSIGYRLSVIIVVSLFIGWWFYEKLEIVSIGIPFGDPLVIGWLIIPAFVCVAVSLYASGVIDGIDGLSGGVFTSIFAAYTVIAYVQNQFNLAAFAATIVGGLLAFLWFNIPPARFYMTETGSMALTLTIGVLAFMTDTLGGGVGVLALPIIGFLLVATVASNILQVTWKKTLHRKLLRIAPLHHHFEAIGWPSYKVTMRYWVLAIMFAFVGALIAITGAPAL